jgi:hypothetical protein
LLDRHPHGRCRWRRINSPPTTPPAPASNRHRFRGEDRAKDRGIGFAPQTIFDTDLM